jgi:hypothetical protein
MNKRILGAHRLGRAVGRGPSPRHRDTRRRGRAASRLSPPVARTTITVFERRRMLRRGIDIGLERHALAAAPALVGGDQKALSQSVIRPASASGEKPPNTTEWIAPIRAQASRANAASGIIGM